jgi:glycosyltransferase involved in cell wall biosynthesis
MGGRDRGRSGTVLLVANYPPDVGFAWWLVDNFWVRLAALARDRGLDSLIVYPEKGPVPETILETGIERVFLPFPGSGPRGWARAIRLVRERGVRFVYFTDRAYSSFFYILLRLCGVRLIINHDHTPGDRPPVRGLKGFLKAAVRRINFLGCDLQLCVSPLIRKRAVNNARIPANRTVVVQNGIEPVECGGDREYAHRVLGLPAGRKICISVARANPYKRIDFAISVARRYVQDLGRDDLVFLHCGDGPDLERLEELVRAWALDGNFFFAGRRQDIHQLLCSSDLALHPAKGEAFSLAILEYMSAGLAVLVPDIPTVCQAIRHGETGMVYPDGDAAAAAGFLAELTADSQKRSRLGREARAEVRDRYSFSRMNQHFTEVMDDALRRVFAPDGQGPTEDLNQPSATR